MEIWPQAPQKLKILICFTFTRSDLIIRFQRAINHYLEIILSQDMTKKRVLGQKMHKYGNSAQTPKFWEFFEIVKNFRIVLSIRF